MTDNAKTAEPVANQATHWYAVYTRPRHEKVVARVLQSGDIEHFLPLFKTENRWHDRYKIVQMPLFPGYLFVHISPLERTRVVMVPGVVCLVSSKGQPVPLPELEIAAIRNYLSMQHPVEPSPYIAAGRRVYISSGPLAGLHGVVVRQGNRFRVVISVDLIMRSMIVDVSIADVVPSPTPIVAATRHCLPCEQGMHARQQSLL